MITTTTIESAIGHMRAIRKVKPGEENDFDIFSNESIIGQINDITSGVKIGALVVSIIALIAAGVGIMNIMLVSVTERTKEIGIRKALGARKKNILLQFLIEAVVLVYYRWSYRNLYWNCHWKFSWKCYQCSVSNSL